MTKRLWTKRLWLQVTAAGIPAMAMLFAHELPDWLATSVRLTVALSIVVGAIVGWMIARRLARNADSHGPRK